MAASSLIIETSGLTKRFGRRLAVENLDLAVPRGCAFGLLGHNGAGKTTLIRLLLGLTRPDTGTVAVSGRRLEECREAVLASVGAIIEEPRFHSHLTGRENLRVVAAVRGPEADARIEPALARVGLSARGDDRVGAYSQGMRQRLALARCLLADPGLVILDEPMNGLDPGGILELRMMIRDLVDEGRTVLLSSHLLDEVEKTCEAAAVIDGGRMIAQGPIRELLADDLAALDIACDDPQAAVDLLDGHPAVTRARLTDDGVRVYLSDRNAVGAINTRLVTAGIVVLRSAPVQASLEDRFLRLTSRAGGDA